MVNAKSHRRRWLRKHGSENKVICKSLKILQTNIRGFHSKKLSLEAIVESKNADIVIINETHLKGSKKTSLPGFTTFCKNRDSVDGGGVATCVRNTLMKDTLKICDSNEYDEIIITRHSQFQTAINIINVYGMQECRNSQEKIFEGWLRIQQEIAKIEAKGELVCLIGDFNKQIGTLVPGNHKDKESFGGSLVRQMIETEKYCLINASKSVTGGPFTRYDPADPENVMKRSILDLVIISAELTEFVETLEIDKDKVFTPYRPAGKKLLHTDHFSVLLVLKDLPLKTGEKVAVKKCQRWNTNKPEGWTKYEEMTGNSRKLLEVAEDTSADTDALMIKIDKELESIKHQVFGKVKVKKGKSKADTVEELQNEKIKLYENKNADDKDEFEQEALTLNEKLSAALLIKQRESLEQDLNLLRSIKSSKGKCAATFRLKDDIFGGKKIGQEVMCIKDPKTDREITDPSEIKRVSLQYCVSLLTNRSPREGYEDDLTFKKLVHRERMHEILENDMNEFTEEMFENTYHILGKKVGHKYDFIFKGGPALKAALFNLCKCAWTSEKLPQSWQKTTLVQLYKGKGSQNLLENMRHIHIKSEFPKFFGHIVVNAMKTEVFSKMTKFQIATKPGHRPQEHIFVVKSIIALFSILGEAVILQFWDFSKFFDRESLVDCMNELYKYNVRGKLYRLLYYMNKNTKFCVQTPLGLTEEANRGEGLGQGTMEGALVSSVSLDSGVKNQFENSEVEASYMTVRLQPLLFQDDVARIATNVTSAQAGNTRMEAVAESKLLDYNVEKSCFVVLGNKKASKKIQTQLMETPLMLCGSKMKQVTKTKYLGDIISANGLAESVSETVKSRTGLAMKAIYEIRSVIDDYRSQICGGLATGLLIWESAVVPRLLYNAEVWIDVSDKTIKQLENIQLRFYRTLFAVGSGCPLPIIYWDTGGMLMKYRILKQKLLFYHHLANLPTSSLAGEIFEVQRRMNLPGLVKETERFLARENIVDVTKCSKQQWKTRIRNLMKQKNEEEILNNMKKYKKLNFADFKDENCNEKDYLSSMFLTQARLNFKLRAKMTPTVQMNFMNDPKFAHNLWTCVGCKSDSSSEDGTRMMDSQSHILRCSGYEDLRIDKNLSNEKDLVDYFSLVIKRRQGCLTT